jgi:single-stranded DNA-binding protein
MNVVVISGNLGRAPQTGMTKANNPYASFRLALNAGDSTHWFSVVAFNGAAERAAELAQGTRVAVTGFLTTKSFEGRDSVEIVATFIEVLTRPVVEEVEAAGEEASCD